jgi:hypothetical protein
MSSQIKALVENIFATPEAEVEKLVDNTTVETTSRFEAFRAVIKTDVAPERKVEGRFAILKNAVMEAFGVTGVTGEVPSVPTTARDAGNRKKTPEEVQAANDARRQELADENAASQAEINKRQARGQAGGAKHFP